MVKSADTPANTPAAAAVLEGLNEAQREAVTAPIGPLRVVAGAGTGKTRVLTRRVAWLVHQGAAPWSVLALTFTNKAARVLEQRLTHLPGAEAVWAGTFHGFGAWLLRRHGDAIGLDTRFSILDRDDQGRILKMIAEDVLPAGSGRLRVAAIAAFISHLKRGGSGLGPLSQDRSGLAACAFEVFESYNERLRAGALLDFDDLLLEAGRLLVDAPEVAEHMRARFRHVLVDEYQDTNAAQRRLLLELVEPGGSLTVVGDPDQSIYGWRGATIENILRFEEDLGSAHTVVLEQNYRSSANILACAEAVIAANQERHAKVLFTDRPAGAPVTVTVAPSGIEEAYHVAERVAAWLARGRRPEDIAIMFRVNAASRSIELALRDAGIPYLLVSGTEFFQRREVKDVLAYARLVANPRDDAAFLRIVNVPRRGVGKTSLERLRARAFQLGVSLFEAAADPEAAGIKGRARSGLAKLRALIASVSERPRHPVTPLLHAIVQVSGYQAALEASDDEIERGRAENVDALLAHAREKDEQRPDHDLSAFLEQTALVSEQDGIDDKSSCVLLMSAHAAKGLEFPCVVVVGVEHGSFPHARSVDSEGQSEEERRLFYVACTRAEDELVLSLAHMRTTYQGPELRTPSPYLQQLPAHAVAYEGGAPAFRSAPALDDPFPDPYPADRVGEGDTTFGAPADLRASHREVGGALGVGDAVRHPYFGEGEVRATDGHGADMRVTVAFASHGERTLLFRHARLERIEA